MPRYFFHLHDAETLRDETGSTLSDNSAARDHAIGVAKELTFKSDKMLGQYWSHWTLRVEDDQGKLVLALPLANFTSRASS
jgi:hypothetical protein